MFPSVNWEISCLQRDAREGKYFALPTWGYLVYRVTYKDQELFEDYLKYVRQAVEASVDLQVAEDWGNNPDLPPDRRLESDAKLLTEAEMLKGAFHLCVLEGPHLDGRSVEDVREIYVEWLRTLDSLPEADFSQLGGCLPEHLDRDMHEREYRSARFDYFMYVDDDILHRFQEIRSAGGESSPFMPEYNHDVAVKMVWKGYTNLDPTDPEDWDEEYENYWQYLHVYRIPRFYDSLVMSNETWFGYFSRPPRLNKFRYSI